MTKRKNNRSKAIIESATTGEPLKGPPLSEEEIHEAFKYLDEIPMEVDIQETNPDEPVVPILTKDELSKLQISQLTIRAAEAELNLQLLQRDIYLAQIDPEGKLKQASAIARSKSDEIALGKQAYNKITKEIEARLGITLKEWAYNDENGQLSKVD